FMNSSMVIWAGAAGADVCGMTTAGAGGTVVGCGGVVASLTVLAPCGFDSIRGKSELPFRIFVPPCSSPHLISWLKRGELKLILSPSCSATFFAVFGITG